LEEKGGGAKNTEKPLTPLGHFPNFSAQSSGQNDKRYCQPYWLFLLEAGVDGVLSFFLGNVGFEFGFVDLDLGEFEISPM
jgi:hypothetical protein